MAAPVEKIIAGLADENEPVLNAELAELSNLNQDGMKVFQAYWANLSPERKKQIIERLLELAENSVELNFDSIFRYCMEDENAGVRGRAIEGLWENEETSLISSLIKILENDISEEVQAAAAVALGKFVLLAEHNKLRSSYAEKIQKALLAAITDDGKGAEVSRRALEAASPMSLPEVQEAIKEAYKSGNSGLKASSIYAMGRSYDSVWLPVLLQELSNADAEIRYEAAGACGELEEEGAVPYLVTAAGNDTDIDVRLAAVQALGKIGNTQARDYLKKCRESSNAAIRDAAEQALNEIGMMEERLTFVEWERQQDDS